MSCGRSVKRVSRFARTWTDRLIFLVLRRRWRFRLALVGTSSWLLTSARSIRRTPLARGLRWNSRCAGLHAARIILQSTSMQSLGGTVVSHQPSAFRKSSNLCLALCREGWILRFGANRLSVLSTSVSRVMPSAGWVLARREGLLATSFYLRLSIFLPASRGI